MNRCFNFLINQYQRYSAERARQNMSNFYSRFIHFCMIIVEFMRICENDGKLEREEMAT